MRCMSAEAGHSELAAEMRSLARRFFAQALAEAGIAQAFERSVQCERSILRVSEDLYDLQAYNRVLVVSFGKAANTMVQALVAQAGSRFEGIVATPVEPSSQIRGFRYFLGGHPMPNGESVRAGEAVLRSLQSLTASSLAIFMISGGGSAILEKPADDEISLEDLVATYHSLVHSGAPIAEINAIRKHLSATKGGRLAQAAYPAQQVSLLISDVPDGTPDALASGPTMPDSTTAADCYAIAAKYGMLQRFPSSVRELFDRRTLEETPKSDDPAFHRSRWWTLLSNKTAVEAASSAAKKAGFAVTVDNSCDDWEYVRAADYLLGRLRDLRSPSKPVCLISGGEITVKVTNGGSGGRNQQFALACAQKIAGENITILSAGTDGIDGNSPAAGAIADGTTLQRAQARGLDAGIQLAAFNAYPLFESLGDTILTGPTGNNVRDLRILLAY
jgi:glycerate 2-kinase